MPSETLVDRLDPAYLIIPRKSLPEKFDNGTIVIENKQATIGFSQETSSVSNGYTDNNGASRVWIPQSICEKIYDR